MSIQEFRQYPELRQEIVRAANRQRNAEVWGLLARLYERLTAHPKPLRPSRWLAVQHGR
ncbi:MAG TPA: hypothetical protein VEQ87_01800 [Burkholderiales bacterium]|nr:hypothetical protein [Burkholderiales bacterium]